MRLQIPFAIRSSSSPHHEAHSRMTYLRNIGAHNAYDVIQDGAEKVHERPTTNDQKRTTNDKIGHRFSSTGRPRLGCFLLTSNAITGSTIRRGFVCRAGSGEKVHCLMIKVINAICINHM